MATEKTTTKPAETVKSVDDLQTELTGKRQDLLEAKKSHKAGELVNPRVLGQTRREIAQILTAIRQQQSKEAK